MLKNLEAFFPFKPINLKMKYSLKLVLVFFYVVVILSSCSSPKEIEYRNYRNLSLSNLGFNSSQITLSLQYYNPNNFGLQLKKTDLDIFIDNNLLGHSSSDTLINIPKRDTFSLPIKIKVDMQHLYKNAFNTLLNKEVTVKVVGRVKVGKANVYMSMPVNYEGKQNFSLFQ